MKLIVTKKAVVSLVLGSDAMQQLLKGLLFRFISKHLIFHLEFNVKVAATTSGTNRSKIIE